MAIAPKEVEFSKWNPRGETEEEIARDPSFQQLKDSVYQLGVLVPIVVHEQKDPARKKYRLVDGERRLRAALATGVDRIPAHIAKGSKGDITEAFHIHMLRKHWRPVAQARALRRILKQLRRTGSARGEEQVLEQLQAITGCSETRLKTLRRAARYPETVLNEVDSDELAFSYLVQFEESFVEQLAQNYPDILKTLGKKQIRQVLLDKARRRILTNTRALMENIVPVIALAKTDAAKAFAGDLLREFLDTPNMSAEEVLERFGRKFPQSGEDLIDLANRTIKEADVLSALLNEIRAADLVSFPKLAREMKTSLNSLRIILNKRLTSLIRVTEKQD
jgi:ParB/RepB/Spo0J family partition protein